MLLGVRYKICRKTEFLKSGFIRMHARANVIKLVGSPSMGFSVFTKSGSSLTKQTGEPTQSGLAKFHMSFQGGGKTEKKKSGRTLCFQAGKLSNNAKRTNNTIDIVN